MTDITKCDGTDCTIKEKCYRYTAIANEYGQSTFVTPPFKDGKCEMFWGVNSEQIFEQLKKILNNKNK
jgi:hypothetical protein